MELNEKITDRKHRPFFFFFFFEKQRTRQMIAFFLDIVSWIGELFNLVLFSKCKWVISILIESKSTMVTYYQGEKTASKVFQIPLKQVEWQILLGGIFLSGGGNMRRSDFNCSNLKATFCKY